MTILHPEDDPSDALFIEQAVPRHGIEATVIHARTAFFVGLGLLLGGCQSLPVGDSRTGGNLPTRVDLVDVRWVAESIGEVPAVSGIESTLQVDVHGQGSGRGGCNPYLTQVTTQGPSIHFASIGGADMYCTSEQLAQESRFFSALTAASTLRIEEDRLSLADRAGKIVLRMKRTEGWRSARA